MESKKQKENIYQSIDDFFKRAIELKDSKLLEKYFQFINKVPYHAPFNNTIVFIQNPECGYYATATQWKNNFNRSIKENARPMVILVPFAPVGFVYDIEDTEGEKITDDEILFWWRNNGGTLNDDTIKKTIKNLEKIDVNIKNKNKWNYFENNDFRTAGYIQKENEKINITLHPKYDKKTLEMYGVLCHEIAHLLLGHLGEVPIEIKSKAKQVQQVSLFDAKHIGKKTRMIAKNRNDIAKNIKELEAELTAWIVFDRIGVKKRSESYIAAWLLNEEAINNISISEIVTVANKIFDMGKRIIYY